MWKYSIVFLQSACLCFPFPALHAGRNCLWYYKNSLPQEHLHVATSEMSKCFITINTTPCSVVVWECPCRALAEICYYAIWILLCILSPFSDPSDMSGEFVKIHRDELLALCTLTNTLPFALQSWLEGEFVLGCTYGIVGSCAFGSATGSITLCLKVFVYHFHTLRVDLFITCFCKQAWKQHLASHQPTLPFLNMFALKLLSIGKAFPCALKFSNKRGPLKLQFHVSEEIQNIWSNWQQGTWGHFFLFYWPHFLKKKTAQLHRYKSSLRWTLCTSATTQHTSSELSDCKTTSFKHFYGFPSLSSNFNSYPADKIWLHLNSTGSPVTDSHTLLCP